MTRTSERHVVWPADRFFWAIIETSQIPTSLLGSPPRRRQRLNYLAEGELPLSLSQLQVVYETVDRNTVLACAVPHSAIGEVDGALTLCPESVPEFLGASVSPRRLNMLIGDYEPLTVQRERRCWRTLTLFLAAGCILLAAIGAERRIHSFTEDERLAALRAADCFESLGYTGAPGLSAARLTAELRELESATIAQGRNSTQSDATPLLASLLAAWPNDIPAGFETLAINPGSITIAATVDAPASARHLAELLDAAATGYSIRPPQLTGARAGTRVTLVFDRQEGDQ